MTYTATPGTAVQARCQALLQCAEKCCPPVPCTRPAAARASFACQTAGCAHASHLLLLCAGCAAHAEAQPPAPTFRAL